MVLHAGQEQDLAMEQRRERRREGRATDQIYSMLALVGHDEMFLNIFFQVHLKVIKKF